MSAELEEAQTSLAGEQAKAADLQGKLSELLQQHPHAAAPAGHLAAEQLGEGQLPDVNPAAVNVVKKDSLGRLL